jgi:hypothetical protein
MPAVESGGGQPLPNWAKAVATRLPRTAAAMLELDLAQRARSPLDRILRAKMRWVIARANRCAYSQAYALADLERAGGDAAMAKSLTGDPARWPEADREPLELALLLTIAAPAVPDELFTRLRVRFGAQRVAAMVLLGAYGNFQDRTVLGLSLPLEPRGPLPPLEVKFASAAFQARDDAHAPAIPAEDAGRLGLSLPEPSGRGITGYLLRTTSDRDRETITAFSTRRNGPKSRCGSDSSEASARATRERIGHPSQKMPRMRESLEPLAMPDLDGVGYYGDQGRGTVVLSLQFSTPSSRLVSTGVSAPAQRQGCDAAHSFRAAGAVGDRGTGAAPGPRPRWASPRSCRLQPPRRVQVGPHLPVPPDRCSPRRRWVLIPGRRPGPRAVEPAGAATPHTLLGAGLLEPSPPARAGGRPRLRPLRSMGGPECRRAPVTGVTTPPHDR